MHNTVCFPCRTSVAHRQTRVRKPQSVPSSECDKNKFIEYFRPRDAWLKLVPPGMAWDEKKWIVVQINRAILLVLQYDSVFSGNVSVFCIASHNFLAKLTFLRGL